MLTKELKLRIISGIFMLALVLFLLFCKSSLPLAIVLFLLVLSGNHEVHNIVNNSGESASIVLSIISSLLFLFFILADFLTDLNSIIYFVFSYLFIVFIYCLFSRPSPKGSVRYIGSNFLSGVFLPFLLSFFWLLKNSPHGNLLLLYLMIAIVASDTGAYFLGKKFGTIKLIPKISPKKSVQGLLAGLISGVFFSFVFYLIFLNKYYLSSFNFIIISFLLVVLGVLGDLFESMLKRDAEMKDSGNIIPGHGGILDRLDSLLFSAPFLYIVLQIFF